MLFGFEREVDGQRGQRGQGVNAPSQTKGDFYRFVTFDKDVIVGKVRAVLSHYKFFMQTNEAPVGLAYPEGLDEQAMAQLVHAIVEGVDRGRMLKDARLRAKHPLLQKQLGEKALNEDILSCLSGVTSHIMQDLGPRMISWPPREPVSIPESILKEYAREPEKMAVDVESFKDAIKKLKLVDPDGVQIAKLLRYLVGQKLEQPTLVQHKILFSVAIAELRGKSRDRVVEILGSAKKEALDLAQGQDDQAAAKIRQEVVEAYEAVLDHFLNGEPVLATLVGVH